MSTKTKVEPEIDCPELDRALSIKESWRGAGFETKIRPDQALGTTDLHEIEMKEALADILACIFAETQGDVGK
jgi:hypothetical protein